MMRPPSPAEDTPAVTLIQRMRRLSMSLRRVSHTLRTEGSGTERETAAIGLGVFIGCLPFYGFHLLICAAAGSLLRLNRLKVYLAANVSNPLVAPWLILAEIQVGARLRHGAFMPLTRDALASIGLWTFAGDLLLGSVVVGSTLGALAAWATYATLRQRRGDAMFQGLVREAADRYAASSLMAWEFAQGKLRHDPVYRAAACDGLLPAGGTLLDLGCGQGLMLAILAALRQRAGTVAGCAMPAPPLFQRLIGVDTRPRVAKLARQALGGEAEIICGDLRDLAPIRADAVILFDVLHMITAAEQDQLIAMLAATLEAGGVIVVREADAAAGWRFTAVRFGNRAKAVVSGRWRQAFYFRSADGWRTCFAQHGLHAEIRPMGQGTPFGNVLIRVTPQPASHGRQAGAAV
jgi:uncharacterized protein (DUF2062 family)/2-polyprenyl-3-methyl-5-hydroxy-6-metoxy-1,4-benzoquinol methylase